MHFLHKLENAKTEANYHAYYQPFIKDGTANGATSNAYLTSSNVSFKNKCIIMNYRPNVSLWITEQAPFIIKNMRIVQILNKSNLPPLP